MVLIAYFGETTRLDQSFTDADGDPINLTGATVYLHVFSDFGEDPILEITGSVIAPASDGLAYFTLTSAQTQLLTDPRYMYEVRLKNSSNEKSCIKGPDTFWVVGTGKVPS